jgi:FKBP-type peptidyl-prolyl cis-trans isomerase FklB
MFVSRFVAVGVLSTLFVANHAFAQSKKPATPVRSAKPAAASASAKKPMLATGRDSLSYSVGYSIAQSMKQQGMTSVNTAMVARGLDDALKSLPLQITEPEMQQIMMAYMQKQYAAKNAEAGKAAEGNKKIGAAFLAENKSKPGVKTTASGLQYIVEKEGTGAKPTASDRVKVHYTGTLIDGKVFDSSVQRGQPTEFGVTEVIKGWTEVLQLMPVGSKWKVFIPSDIAYGDRGAGADIGPGSTLIFDIELLDIVKSN